VAVIIGGGTTITTDFLSDGDGVTSVSFDFTASVERLWQLGSFSPYITTVTQQRNVSVNVYGIKPDGGGGTNALLMAPSTSCADATSVSIELNATLCQGGGSESFQDDFFVTSYSYSKDFTSYGTESWSFVNKPSIDTYTGTIYMLRGMPTGKILSQGDGILTNGEMGMLVDEGNSQDSSGNNIESEAGSVSAGFPGIGNFDVSREVVVYSVGASTGYRPGYKGNASCSVPVQPIYL